MLISWMVVTIALSAKYIWVVVTHDWSALEVRTWHDKKTNTVAGGSVLSQEDIILMVWRKETATSKWGRYSILHGPTELEPTALGQWNEKIIKKSPIFYKIYRFISYNYCNHLTHQDWISITYLLFYIIVYVVVIALAQEVKRHEVRMTITIMGCDSFSLQLPIRSLHFRSRPPPMEQFTLLDLKPLWSPKMFQCNNR